MEKQLSIKGDIFLLSDDKSLLKLNAIHDYLTSSYWSTGISKTLVERAIDNSLRTVTHTEMKADLSTRGVRFAV